MKILTYVSSNFQPITIDTSGDFNRIRIQNASSSNGAIQIATDNTFSGFYYVTNEIDLPLIPNEPLYVKGYNNAINVILYKENIGGSSCKGFTGTIDLTAK